MSQITRTASRKGLAGFPAGFEPVAHDDLGDILAVDARGKVWCFEHGAGDWSSKTPAFATMAQLEAYVAFQDAFEAPVDRPERGVPELQELAKRIRQFVQQQGGARYTRETARTVLAEIRDALADRRWATSKLGRSVTLRRELGARCEQALQAAGADGKWMVRPHAERMQALVVAGRFEAPWTEAKVLALLQPLVGKHELVCRQMPAGW